MTQSWKSAISRRPVLSGLIAALGLAIVVVGMGLTVLGLIQASLHGIYAAALYRYAESGETSAGFDSMLLDQAFRSKK